MFANLTSDARTSGQMLNCATPPSDFVGEDNEVIFNNKNNDEVFHSFKSTCISILYDFIVL